MVNIKVYNSKHMYFVAKPIHNPHFILPYYYLILRLLQYLTHVTYNTCDIYDNMVRAMCGLQLKDRKKSTDLTSMLGLSETIDELAMANSVH